MTTEQQLREAITNKTAKVLTVDLANELKGRKIATLYFGYRGQDGFDEFIVGNIIDEYTDHNNKAVYALTTAEGSNTFIRAHEENLGAFTCSDTDRFVYFIDLPTYVKVNGCGNFNGWKLKIVNFVRRETEPTCGDPFNIFLCENPDGTITEWSDNVFAYEN